MVRFVFKVFTVATAGVACLAVALSANAAASGSGATSNASPPAAVPGCSIQKYSHTLTVPAAVKSAASHAGQIIQTTYTVCPHLSRSQPSRGVAGLATGHCARPLSSVPATSIHREIGTYRDYDALQCGYFEAAEAEADIETGPGYATFE